MNHPTGLRFRFKEMITVSDCRESPANIFVFGDNLLRKGKAGQAIIRDEPNSFGIPTKRLPSMRPEAFFSDKEDEIEAVRKALEELRMAAVSYEVVLPVNPPGSGLARLPEKSPVIWRMIQEFYAMSRGEEL